MNKILFKIDGTRVEGCILDKDNFVKKFHELETLMQSDCKKFWVLYEENNAFPWSVGQYSEIFWCIPTSEITFIRVDGEWHYLKNELSEMLDTLFGGVVTDKKEPSPVGVSGIGADRVTSVKVSGVTLDENEDDEEEHLLSCIEHERLLEKFALFYKNFANYLTADSRSNESDFMVYKDIQKWIKEPVSREEINANKIRLISYLEEYWYAWLESVLLRTYQYMNLTQIVWESWESQQ